MSAFQPGDRVRCILPPDDGPLKAGWLYTVSSVDRDEAVRLVEPSALGLAWLADRFERIGNPTIPEATLMARGRALENGSSRTRNPGCGLNFSAPSKPSEFNSAWHEGSAELIAGLFATQVKAATLLGLAAAPMGFGTEANPFTKEPRLAEAWSSGWHVGNDGMRS